MRSSNSVFEMEPNAPFPQANLSVTLKVIVRLSDVIATSEQFAISMTSSLVFGWDYKSVSLC